jgi:hypothetical protein
MDAGGHHSRVGGIAADTRSSAAILDRAKSHSLRFDSRFIYDRAERVELTRPAAA